jgi:hypothetical protein
MQYLLYMQMFPFIDIPMRRVSGPPGDFNPTVDFLLDEAKSTYTNPCSINAY